jgi:hypothetical protein
MSEIGLIFIPDQSLLFKVKSKGILPIPCGDRLPRILGIVSVSGLQLVARVASNGVLDSIKARDKFSWLDDEDYWALIGSNKTITKSLLNDISKNILAMPPEFEEYPNVAQPFVITSTSNQSLIRFIEYQPKPQKPEPQYKPASSIFTRALVR